MLILSGSNVIEDFAKLVVEGIRNNIRNKQVTPHGSMHSSGEAEESVFYRITDNGLQIGSTWAYITVLEDGRKPGKFAPPEVIEDYVEDKPVVGDIPKKSLAFLINRSLKEKGSLLWQQGGNSGVLSEFTNIEFVREHLKEPLANALVKELTSILFKQTA